MLLLDNVVLEIKPNKHAAIIKTITLNTFITVYFNSAVQILVYVRLSSADTRSPQLYHISIIRHMSLLREKDVVITRKDVVLTRKICRFNEKISRYYEKICRFNEKRSRYNEKICRFNEKRSRYNEKICGFNEKRSRYYEKISRYNEKRSRYYEKRSRYYDIEWKILSGWQYYVTVIK